MLVKLSGAQLLLESLSSTCRALGTDKEKEKEIILAGYGGMFL